MIRVLAETFPGPRWTRSYTNGWTNKVHALILRGGNRAQFILAAVLKTARQKYAVTFFNIIRLTCHWVAKISGTYMGTYFIRENMSTRLVHNFLNIDPFLTRLVPLESSHSQLSNGINLVKNGYMLRKLWTLSLIHI